MRKRREALAKKRREIEARIKGKKSTDTLRTTPEIINIEK